MLFIVWFCCRWWGSDLPSWLWHSAYCGDFICCLYWWFGFVVVDIKFGFCFGYCCLYEDVALFTLLHKTCFSIKIYFLATSIRKSQPLGEQIWATGLPWIFQMLHKTEKKTLQYSTLIENNYIQRRLTISLCLKKIDFTFPNIDVTYNSNWMIIRMNQWII